MGQVQWLAELTLNPTMVDFSTSWRHFGPRDIVRHMFFLLEKSIHHFFSLYTFYNNVMPFLTQ